MFVQHDHLATDQQMLQGVPIKYLKFQSNKINLQSNLTFSKFCHSSAAPVSFLTVCKASAHCITDELMPFTLQFIEDTNSIYIKC